MNYFLAKNDKELGLCLRMLFAEGFDTLHVESVETEKKRLVFHIDVEMDAELFARLQKRYSLLIS